MARVRLMDTIVEHRPSRLARAARATPFVCVALCFLLPFFSVSSCGAGTTATASGVDILTGARLTVVQVSQPIGPVEGDPDVPPPHVRFGTLDRDDPVVQAQVDRVRPWTILGFAAVVLGSVLVVAVRGCWRVPGAAAAIAALLALGYVWVAVVGGMAVGADPSTDPEVGLNLAVFVLLLTAVGMGVGVVRSVVPSRRPDGSDPPAGPAVE
jgi:hypothetical protein